MKVVAVDPLVMGGTPCFAGTRVPIESLIDWITAGDSLDYWLENFPSVTRQQAETLLREGAERLVAEARSAA